MLRMTEACAEMGVCRNTMRSLLTQGHIQGRKLPSGHWRIDPDSIRQWKHGSTKQKALDLMRRKNLCP